MDSNYLALTRNSTDNVHNHAIIFYPLIISMLTIPHALVYVIDGHYIKMIALSSPNVII